MPSIPTPGMLAEMWLKCEDLYPFSRDSAELPITGCTETGARLCKFLLTVRRLETNSWTLMPSLSLPVAWPLLSWHEPMLQYNWKSLFKKGHMLHFEKRTSGLVTPISVGSLMIWAYLQILELHYLKYLVLSVTSNSLGTLKRPVPLKIRMVVNLSMSTPNTRKPRPRILHWKTYCEEWNLVWGN